MGLKRGNLRSEEFEWITNRDLVDSAHLLMGQIDLDPASSSFANEYVGAKHYYTPKEDGLNEEKWFGNVYLFPPSQSYFWHKKSQRWKITRGIFFSNFIDMTMYCQDIFDHPVCIMKSRPTLIRHYYADDNVMSRNTGCSLIVYLQPKDNIEKATQEFIDIYSEKGRIIV